ncbi:hypothetical protein GCM10010302_29250 [Streptomyces polychromogenes]|uniref:Integral membrane protein n=1 Tax=Streptomyces polychromogenes TaxID=67342 RepID=A0ABP3F0A1_9ACTN
MSHQTGWGQPHPHQPAPHWGGWTPPPPQPGVIPLRPLTLGDVLSGAFTTFRRHWKPLTGVILLVQGVGILLVAAAVGFAAFGLDSRFAAVFDRPDGEGPAAGDVASLFLYLAPVLVLTVVTVVLGAGMLAALCPAVIQEAVLGRPVTFGAMWRRCWSRLPSVLGVLLCVGLLTGGPLLVLYAVCFPPIVMSVHDASPPAAVFVLLLGVLLWMPVLVWLGVRYSLAPAVAVCEGLGPVAAMRRSARLVSGGWWRTFGIAGLAYLVASAVGYVIQMPFVLLGFFSLIPALIAMGDAADPGTLLLGVVGYVVCMLVGSVLGSVFQVGYPQLVLSLLYVDQRIRKEDLAESLAVAASLPAQPGPAGA